MSDTHKQFKVSQQIVLRNEEGSVLLLHEPTNGNWILPGGRVEEGETDMEESLRREVREELGIEITIGRPVGADITRNASTYAIAFLAETNNLADIHLSTEHDEMLWVPPTELVDRMYYKKIAAAIAALAA